MNEVLNKLELFWYDLSSTGQDKIREFYRMDADCKGNYDVQPFCTLHRERKENPND